MTLQMPDVEEWAYTLLSPLGGIHVFAYGATARWPFVTEDVDLQVDVRASSKKRARDRAYEVRNLLLTAPLDGSTPWLSRCQIVGGPFWAPDEDGAPRYVLRVTLTARGGRDLVEGTAHG